MTDTYPKVFDSATGQWTSLFQEAVNIENIGGLSVNDLQDEDLLVYKTASNAFINEDIDTYLENKNIRVNSLNIEETLIVNGEIVSGGDEGVTTEQIQDAAAPLFTHSFHSNISATYDDDNDRILLTGTAPTSIEEIQDAAAPLFTHNDHTNITASYDDAANKIILSASVDLNVSTEQIQDAAAPLLNHNFHTNITATYDDANDRILLTGLASGGSGSAAPITNFYDVVRDFGADPNETDSRAKIQNALNAARDSLGGIVYIPPGDWDLGGGLRIYSNTHLMLAPRANMRKMFSGGSMLWNGDNNANYSGYNGQINITITGGVWDCRGTAFSAASNIFSLAHSQNLTIRDVTFRNVGGFHAIEINSTKNAFVENCRFLGFVNTGNRGFSEALQIDGAFRQGVFGEFGSYDKTICSDVTVSRCYFGASGFGGTVAWPTGVGSHNADTSGSILLSNAQHLNTKIINNTFEGLTEYAVRTDGVHRECLISNNMFIDCSGGVGLGFKTQNLNESWQLSFNITVSNNIFNKTLNSARDCIFARNIDGLIINNNQISYAGKSGIRLRDCNKAKISSNRLEFISEHGIQMQNTKDCMVDHNIFKNVSRSANNVSSFIRYTLSPERCSTIGNRGSRDSNENIALRGLNIVSGTFMRSYGNHFAQGATTGFFNNSTGHQDETINR